MPDFTKKAQVSWMCFISLNYLYTAHHNLLGICHQLKIHHLYRTFNFSTQCICMGTGSLFVYVCCHLRGNARPLWRKIVFAVASILGAQGKKVYESEFRHGFVIRAKQAKIVCAPLLMLETKTRGEKFIWRSIVASYIRGLLISANASGNHTRQYHISVNTYIISWLWV